MTASIIHKFIHTNVGMDYKKYAILVQYTLSFIYFFSVPKQQFIPPINKKYEGNKH